jgi:hypothetical protein
MVNLYRLLESLDVFDKLSEKEYEVKTFSGAVLSLLLSGFGALVFMIMFGDLMLPDLSRNLGASRTVPGETFLVNISLSILVTFPCNLLHLDTRDSLGFTQLYANTVTLRRSSPAHHFIGYAAYPNRSTCLPCYGIRPAGECCNSCEELYLLHRLKNIKPTPEKWSQCEGVSNFPSPSEHCLLKGKLLVNKVPGVFTVRFTRSLYNSTSQPLHKFNLSHVLGRIRFGPKVSGTSAPLEMIRVIQKSDEPLHYRYDLVCTPVSLVTRDRIIARTFEYTPIGSSSLPSPEKPPGIFFKYQFTPYTVTITVSMKSFGSLIAGTFGVLSGGFALTMLIDKFLYREAASQTPIE